MFLPFKLYNSNGIKSKKFRGCARGIEGGKRNSQK